MTDDQNIPEDPLPAMIAALDQSLSVLPHLAHATWRCFEAYKAEGFTDSQAVYLAACQMHGGPGEAP